MSEQPPSQPPPSLPEFPTPPPERARSRPAGQRALPARAGSGSTPAQQPPASPPPAYQAPPAPTYAQPVPIQQAPANGARSGCFWVLVGGLMILLVPVLCMVGLLLLGITSVNNITTGFSQMINPAPVVSVYPSQSIVTSIQPLGELTSIRMQMAKADLRVNISQGPLGVCGHSASYVAEGTVEAGLDLSGISEDNIRYDALTDTYTITLPAPQLLDCNVHFMDQYSGSLTLCNVDWDTARQLGQHVALLDFRDDALESGIVGQAEQQARLVVSNFVRSLTGSNVVIEFEGTDLPLSTTLPRTCTPEIPGEWQYDGSNNTWTTP